MKHEFVVECYIPVEFECPCEDDCECDTNVLAVEQARRDVSSGTYIKDYGEIIER